MAPRLILIRLLPLSINFQPFKCCMDFESQTLFLVPLSALILNISNCNYVRKYVNCRRVQFQDCIGYAIITVLSEVKVHTSGSFTLAKQLSYMGI